MGKSRGARAPWNGSSGEPRKGRPARVAKVAERRPSCIWPRPARGGTCGAALQDGLAVCPEHAMILRASAGHECAWPPCTQYAAYRSLCPYHEKIVRGLLVPAR
jgi:hypothetical protein